MPLEPPKDDHNIYAFINYEDTYVQPLVIAALKRFFPPSTLQFITSLTQLPTPTSRVLQFLQYESINFDHLLHHPSTSLANAYIIRKALIRKHYLSTTVSNWIVKHPDTLLARHVKPSVEFEVDYAEFLDDALVEAWELKESWARNLARDGDGKEKEKEWWILKPGMSERGQGIRLFSSEEELVAIFEEWDPESDEEDEDGVEEREREGDDVRSHNEVSSREKSEHTQKDKSNTNGIITSQLRHFIAQPYIHPPLLLSLPNPSSCSSHSTPTPLHKFHIRTYVVAVGALKVYVYRPMLALFAAQPYAPPWSHDLLDDREEGMKAHLTNTCLQETSEREGSVGLFWELELGDEAVAGTGQADVKGTTPVLSSSSKTPTDNDTTTTTNKTPLDKTNSWKSQTFTSICSITATTFEAAARSMSIHFQPLPNAFEIFGLDFMIGVDPLTGELTTYLLEVNAFPDFRQTGEELKGLVEGLFEGVVEVGVRGFYGLGSAGEGEGADGGEGGERRDMVKVLDIDLGRR